MKCDNWIACLAHLQKNWPPDIFWPTLPSKFAMLTQTGRFAKERVLKSKSAIKQICLRTEHLCLTRSPIGNPCSANDQTAMGQKVATMVAVKMLIFITIMVWLLITIILSVLLLIKQMQLLLKLHFWMAWDVTVTLRQWWWWDQYHHKKHKHKYNRWSHWEWWELQKAKWPWLSGECCKVGQFILLQNMFGRSYHCKLFCQEFSKTFLSGM